MLRVIALVVAIISPREYAAGQPARAPRTDNAQVDVREIMMRQRDGRPRSLPARDTAMFIELLPPSSDDTTTLSAWLRVSKAVFGSTDTTIDLRTATAFVATALPGEQRFARVREALIPHSSYERVSPAQGLKSSQLIRSVGLPLNLAEPTDALRWAPISRALYEQLEDDLATLANGRLLAMSGPVIEASFGPRPTVNNDDKYGDGFGTDFVTRLRDAVGEAVPLRNTYLVILDSGWPDTTTKKRSVALLDSLLATARELYGIKVPLGPDPEVRWQPPSNDHAIWVARSIAPLTAIKNDRLNLLYLPLTFSASDAPIVRRLLETYHLIRHQDNRLNFIKGAPCILAAKQGRRQHLACMAREANSISRVPKDIDVAVRNGIAALTEATTNGAIADGLPTTADVYNAIWHILEAWSFKHDQVPSFISASWTAAVRPYYMPARRMLGGNVITVAAAGNDNLAVGRNEGPDFVKRAHDGDVAFVIVENRRSDMSAMCSSSLVRREGLPNSATVAFHFGLVAADPPWCGSSFAAPRVAWTMAFAQTLRPRECDAIPEFKEREAALEAAARNGQASDWPIRYLNIVSRRQTIPIERCKQ